MAKIPPNMHRASPFAVLVHAILLPYRKVSSPMNQMSLAGVRSACLLCGPYQRRIPAQSNGLCRSARAKRWTARTVWPMLDVRGRRRERERRILSADKV